MNHLFFEQSKPRDIAVLGRSGVDLYPDQFGPMNQVISFSKFVGGSPANTAVQLAKMGVDTAFISKVSQDHFGQYVRYYLASQGIDISHTTDCCDPTIRHSLAVAEQPEKSKINYFFYRNNIADQQLSMDDIDEQFISQFKAILISGTSLSKSPSREAIILAIEYAHRNNVKVIFDPDYRASEWDNENEAALYCWQIANKSDLIFGTRDELNIIEKLYLPDNCDDLCSANALLQHQATMVTIKRGVAGSNVYQKNGSIFHGDIYPAHLYKELGAGDSFAGAFLSRLIKNRPVQEALRYGAAAASLTISGKSCSDSMPVQSVVEDYMSYADAGHAEDWPGWLKL